MMDSCQYVILAFTLVSLASLVLSVPLNKLEFGAETIYILVTPYAKDTSCNVGELSLAEITHSCNVFGLRLPL